MLRQPSSFQQYCKATVRKGTITAKNILNTAFKIHIFPGYKVNLNSAALFPQTTNIIQVASCACQILWNSQSSKTLLETVCGTVTA